MLIGCGTGYHFVSSYIESVELWSKNVDHREEMPFSFMSEMARRTLASTTGGVVPEGVPSLKTPAMLKEEFETYQQMKAQK